MAVTYGFYNSINKDRMYNAIQMSQIFDGIINDGVYMSVLSHFAVRAGSGMSVVVGGGRAWFDHTWTYNDSDMILNIDESEFEAGRIDAIIIKIDRRDSGRVNTVEVIKGTPSEHPVKPTLEDGNDIYYHPLAYVTVNAGVTEITDANIENAIGVDTRTPYVTGIIETISAEDLITQWQSEWDAWNAEHRQAYLDWVETQEADMESWIATQEADMESWERTQKSSFETWNSQRQAAFEAWFTNLRNELDDHQAAHLQNEIDEINEREYKRYYNICTKQTSIFYDDYGDISRILSEGEGVSAITTFSTDEETRTITTRVTDGVDTYVETVTINNGNIVENYTKM